MKRIIPCFKTWAAVVWQVVGAEGSPTPLCQKQRMTLMPATKWTVPGVATVARHTRSGS